MAWTKKPFVPQLNGPVRGRGPVLEQWFSHVVPGHQRIPRIASVTTEESRHIRPGLLPGRAAPRLLRSTQLHRAPRSTAARTRLKTPFVTTAFKSRSLPSLRTMPGSSLVWSFHSLQLHTISVCFLTGLTQEAVSFMKAEHMGVFYHCVHTCTHIVTAHSGCSAIIDSVMKFYEFISHSNPFKRANWGRAHPS